MPTYLTTPTFARDGVVAGFVFDEGAGLTPIISPGVLFAQGTMYRPGVAPALPAAPAAQQSWLYYNSASGFYWQNTCDPLVATDAFLGWVVTDDTHVIVCSVRRIGLGIEMAIGQGGAVQPVEPTGDKPPGVVAVAAPTVTVDRAGNVMLTFDVTYPAALGSMDRLYVRVERPYRQADGGTDVDVPSASTVDELGPFPLAIVGGVVQNTQAYIVLPAPTAMETWAAWFMTGSRSARNLYTDASAVMVTFLVSSTAGLIAGAEWAPNPPNPIGATIEREIREGAEQWWRLNLTWTIPDDDGRLAEIASWEIGLLDPEIAAYDVEAQIIFLASLPPAATSYQSAWAKVPDHTIRFVAMVRPKDKHGRQNSYVPGVTAALTVPVGPITTAPGMERAALVTGLTATAAWTVDPQGSRVFAITVDWTAPADDPRWGGVVLRLVSTGAYATAPGQIVTGVERLAPFVIALGGQYGPTVAGVWSVLAISVDANNNPNDYVAGVTPSASFAVGPYHEGAPLGQATSFSVAAAYGDPDANGKTTLILTPTFTPPTDPTWAYADFWAERPDTLEWYLLASVDKSGTPVTVEQLPSASGTWHFVLIDRDTHGKDAVGGATSNPAAPPPGSATYSLAIDPPATGAAGHEYADQVTIVSIVVGANVPAPDGTYRQLVTATITPPSDTRYGGCSVVYEDAGGVRTEWCRIDARQTVGRFAWRPPAGSVSGTWWVVAHDVNGRTNSIVDGVTPKVTGTYGSTSQLDFSAAKLASLNQSLLRVNPVTGLFEPYQAEQAIFGALQLGGGTANGIADVSGTAVHRLTGNVFDPAWEGKTIYIANVAYTVAAVADGSNLTLTSSAGVQTGANWSYGRPPRLAIYDRTNSLMFWSGDDSAGSGYVGTFAAHNFRAGGTIAAPIFEVDGSGAVTIKGATFEVDGAGWSAKINATDGVLYADGDIRVQIKQTSDASVGHGGLKIWDTDDPTMYLLAGPNGLSARDGLGNGFALLWAGLNYLSSEGQTIVAAGIVTCYNAAGRVASYDAEGIWTLDEFNNPVKLFDAVIPEWTAVTYENSWVDVGGGYSPCQFWLDQLGNVHLQGSCKNGTYTDGTTLFTLPSGARPMSRVVLIVLAGGSVARLEINTDGTTKIYSAAYNSSLHIPPTSFATI